MGFHPLRPLLLSVAGSRHYTEGDGTDSPSSDSESTDEETDGVENDAPPARKIMVKRPRERPSPTVKDASFKVWNCDQSSRLAGQMVGLELDG